MKQKRCTSAYTKLAIGFALPEQEGEDVNDRNVVCEGAVLNASPIRQAALLIPSTKAHKSAP